MKFRRELWTHQPLTDFWRVGRGYAKKLEANGMFTMGDVGCLLYTSFFVAQNLHCFSADLAYFAGLLHAHHALAVLRSPEAVSYTHLAIIHSSSEVM